MTKDQFEKAASLLDQLNNLTDARNAIKNSISLRERQLEYVSPHSPLFGWLRKCVGKCVVSANKLSVSVHAEGAKTVEFEIDEGFIGTILLYLDARIDEKTNELAAL